MHRQGLIGEGASWLPRAGILVGVVVLTACSAVVDSTGLVGGSDQRSAPSVVSSAPPAGLPRPSLAPPPTAGTGAPQSPASAGQTKPWCETRPPGWRKCFDFEDGDLASFVLTQTSGKLAVASGALHVQMNADEQGLAMMKVPIELAPASVRYAFDVRLDGLQPFRGAEFNEIAFRYGEGGCAIQPTIVGDRISISEYCAGGGLAPVQDNHHTVTIEPGSGWHRFEVHIDFAARTLTATVTRPDGISGGVDVPLHPQIVPAQAELRLGITWSPSGVTPGHKLWTDNVTLDWD